MGNTSSTNNNILKSDQIRNHINQIVQTNSVRETESSMVDTLDWMTDSSNHDSIMQGGDGSITDIFKQTQNRYNQFKLSHNDLVDSEYSVDTLGFNSEKPALNNISGGNIFQSNNSEVNSLRKILSNQYNDLTTSSQPIDLSLIRGGSLSETSPFNIESVKNLSATSPMNHNMVGGEYSETSNDAPVPEKSSPKEKKDKKDKKKKKKERKEGQSSSSGSSSITSLDEEKGSSTSLSSNSTPSLEDEEDKSSSKSSPRKSPSTISDMKTVESNDDHVEESNNESSQESDMQGGGLSSSESLSSSSVSLSTESDSDMSTTGSSDDSSSSSAPSSAPKMSRSKSKSSKYAEYGRKIKKSKKSKKSLKRYSESSLNNTTEFNVVPFYSSVDSHEYLKRSSKNRFA